MSRASGVGALHDGGLHLAGVKAALPEQETQNSTCPDAGVTPKRGKTCSITRTLTSSTGVVTTQTDDFLITKATERDGHLLATGLEDMTRVPSALVPGGLFVFRSYTRRPD